MKYAFWPSVINRTSSSFWKLWLMNRTYQWCSPAWVLTISNSTTRQSFWWHSIPLNNGNIHASVLRKDTRAILLPIHDPEIAGNSIILGIYAPAQANQKEKFWSHLMDLHQTFDLPWCLIGDFHELANPVEKNGRLGPNSCSVWKTVPSSSIQMQNQSMLMDNSLLGKKNSYALDLWTTW